MAKKKKCRRKLSRKARYKLQKLRGWLDYLGGKRPREHTGCGVGSSTAYKYWAWDNFTSVTMPFQWYTSGDDLPQFFRTLFSVFNVERGPYWSEQDAILAIEPIYNAWRASPVELALMGVSVDVIERISASKAYLKRKWAEVEAINGPNCKRGAYRGD